MTEDTDSTKSALVYQGTIITQRQEMLSLTDMWRAAGSDPQQTPAKWRALPTTKDFVDHVELTIGKSDSLFLVKEGRGGTTLAHWQIGLAYAKYLSPEFHMWCNTVVRERMEGKLAPAHIAAAPRIVSSTFRSYMSICRAIGLDRNQAALSAARATKADVGFDPLERLGVTHLLAPQQEALLTPTDIGKRLGGKSAIAVNHLLQEKGLQIGRRDLKDKTYWEPTNAGSTYAVFLDTGKKHGDGTPVRQLKWNAGIIAALGAPSAAGIGA